MTAQWNPQQYEKFKGQRAKPFFDLKSLVVKNHFKSAVDLGCGTGELTRILFDELKPQSMIGLDSSREMLAQSAQFSGGGLSFQQSDIAEFNPAEKFDLLFSNAALQWVANHEELIPKLLSWIAPGGQVAIQVPCNYDHPSHVVAARVAKRRFPEIFPEQKVHVLAVERYAEILFENGFTEQIARVEVYGHAMASGLDVIEWTKGTLLTGYQSKLSESRFAEFLAQYQHELFEEIGGGERPYFYAFKRILFWGLKQEGPGRQK